MGSHGILERGSEPHWAALDRAGPAATPQPPRGGPEPTTRRSLLAGLLGGLAGLLAGSLGRPTGARAAAGDPLIIGSETNTAGTANTKLQTNSTGTAFYVQQNGTGTALRANAVGAGAIAGFFTSNAGEGISGVTANNAKFGVYGGNDASSYGNGSAVRANGKQNHGLVATSANASANAVRAIHQATSGEAEAVWGETASPDGVGVVGLATASSGTTFGVYGQSASPDGVGVFGWATASSGTTVGVYGQANSSSGYAGYFAGNAAVTGTLSKGGGSFKIDHPLDPENKWLQHSFVESPDMMNVYNGNVETDDEGLAVVELPAWFEALNRDFRYQLTPIGAWTEAWIATEIENNRFTIRTARPRTKVSWQVTGIRQDAWANANRIKVEVPKSASERGKYAHPEAYGKPASKGIDYLDRERLEATRRPQERLEARSGA